MSLSDAIAGLGNSVISLYNKSLGNNINKVAEIDDEVVIVANNNGNVSAVGNNINSVNTCAANISAIQSASSAASIAQAQAELAEASATEAEASATSATNSANLLSQVYQEVVSQGQITVPTIDTTLSVSGAAADAASVGAYTDILNNYGDSETYTNTAHAVVSGYIWAICFPEDTFVKAWYPETNGPQITYCFGESTTDAAQGVSVTYTSDIYTCDRGDSIKINRILGPRSFLIVLSGSPLYTPNGQAYGIKAPLASIVDGEFSEILPNDNMAGTFILSRQFNNIPSREELEITHDKLENYGKTYSATNVDDSDVSGSSAYWALFFDKLKYLKSWTPALNPGGKILVTFGKTETDIADGVIGEINTLGTVVSYGETLQVNKYMTHRDFIKIQPLTPAAFRYSTSASVANHVVQARIAALDSSNQFSEVNELINDAHAGVFTFEDRYTNIPTNSDIKSIINTLENYGNGDNRTYTNTGNATLNTSVWFFIYFDKPTYVKSWTPEYNGGSIQYAFASASTNIADGVSLTVNPTRIAQQGETIAIEKFFTTKDCLLVKGNIKYCFNEITNVPAKARLALYDNNAADLSNFLSNAWAGEFVISTLEFPGIPTRTYVNVRIEEVRKDMPLKYPCSFSLFSNFGVIGDSYGCGAAMGSGGSYVNGYEQSWEKILERMTGSTAYPFCISGSTTASWLANNGEHGLGGLLAAPPLQLYILGHVINDANVGLTVGSVADLIGVADPTTLPNTFVNNMAKIRYYCLQKSPNAKIIYMLSDGYTYNYINKAAYDAATIQVANFYETPYINQHDHPYYALDVYKNLTAGHPTVQGYSVMAKAIKDLVEECMGKSEYTNYFNSSLQTN